MAATARRGTGCPKAMPPCGRRAGRRRSTGRRMAVTGLSSPWPGAARLPTTSRWFTSATSRPTPTPAGPGPGCRPRRSGSTPRLAPRPPTCRICITSRGPGEGLRQLFGEVWQFTSSRLLGLPRVQAGRRRDRGVQRQVHGQPDGPARQLLCDARGTYPDQLPELLSRIGQVDVRRRAAGTVARRPSCSGPCARSPSSTVRTPPGCPGRAASGPVRRTRRRSRCGRTAPRRRGCCCRSCCPATD